MELKISLAQRRRSYGFAAAGHDQEPLVIYPLRSLRMAPNVSAPQRKEPTMQLTVQSVFRQAFRLFAAGFALSFALWNTAYAAAAESFRGLKVEVVGNGRPVLMI